MVPNFDFLMLMILVLVIFKYSRELSIPMTFLFSIFPATAVVPDPTNGSRISDDSSVEAWMILVMTDKGF